MSDTITASIVGVTGALFGVTIGWLLNRWTVNHTVKQQEFYKAAAAFRAAFVDEYRVLRAVIRPEDVEDAFVQTTLTTAAAKHENACVLFRPYLSKKKKQQFDEAWKDYLVPEGSDMAELPSPFIDYYSESQHDVPIRLALEKLDKVMEFAKPI
jgi:hypothetical protein